MLEKTKLVLLAALCLSIFAYGFFWVYSNFNSTPEVTIHHEEADTPQLQTEVLTTKAGDAIEHDPPASSESPPPPLAAETISVGDRIGTDTQIVYEYYYPGEGETRTASQSAPYAMLDLTREQLISKINGWQVVSFSDKEVVLRKNMDDSIKKYVLGVWEGYVAVFYSDSENMDNLMEVTDTPISALSEEEQQKLDRGIAIEGEHELMKILEDYGS